MASDPKITALQTVLNRFPSTNPTLVPDGLLGDKTAAALIKALTWIAANVEGSADTAQGLASKLLTSSGGYNFIQIRQSAEGITTYLNDRADDKRLTLISTTFKPTVKTAPAAASDQVLAHNQQSKAVAVAKQATQAVPAWAFYAGGAALIAAALGATMYSIKKGKRGGPTVPASAVAGAPMNEWGLTWTQWWRAAGFRSESKARRHAYRAWKRGEDPADWRMQVQSNIFDDDHNSGQRLLGWK